MSTDPTAIDLQRDPRTQRFSGVAIHGDMPFDVPYVSEIAPNLWVGGCAFGLVLPRDVDHLVSLYQWERYEVRHDLYSSLTIRMFDSLTGPAVALLDALAGWINVCRQTGVTLVHCQAGLNRSGLVAAWSLMVGPERMRPQDAVALLREKRSPAVLCNPAFRELLARRALADLD